MFLFHPLYFLNFLVKSQPQRSYKKGSYIKKSVLGSFYRKTRYNEFVGKQPKCSLYRGKVIIDRTNKRQRR